MTDALSIIYYIFNKFIDLIFNRLEIFTDVTLGWVTISVLIISIMISNILSVARASQSHQIERDK